MPKKEERTLRVRTLDDGEARPTCHSHERGGALTDVTRPGFALAHTHRVKERGDGEGRDTTPLIDRSRTRSQREFVKGEGKGAGYYGRSDRRVRHPKGEIPGTSSYLLVRHLLLVLVYFYHVSPIYTSYLIILRYYN